VTGSQCLGFDCATDGSEDFGYDSIRFKENNIRIKFEDTSTGSFPANDWQITINDTVSGGANYFSIDDVSSAKVPFKIIAGAPTNSLYVDSSGRVGFKTSTPVVEAHIRDGDTPTIRLEQDNSYGWSAQTWDVAGNESNFFIRDVTNGSKLPFRIRPNAPGNSIYIHENDGNVGLGTASPDYPLDVERTGADVSIAAHRADGATAVLVGTGSAAQVGSATSHPVELIVNNTVQATLDASGNLTLGGLLTEASDRDLKENFAMVDGKDVLAGIAQLPISSWNFIADDDESRHIGPMAQDFYVAFGLGADDKHIAPLDANGVALAGVQALHAQLLEQETQIDTLEARLAALESAGNPAQPVTFAVIWLLAGSLGTILLGGLGWMLVVGLRKRAAS